MGSNYTDALIYATGWTVVHSIWQALTIALILSVVLISTPRRLAHWRYNCAGVALLLVLLTSGTTFFLYFRQGSLENGTGLISFTQFSIGKTAPEGFWEYWQNRFTDYFNQHLPLIVTIWICGLTFFILRMLGGLAYVRQLRHQGTNPVGEEWEEVLRELAQKLRIPRAVALMESIRIQSPLVIGHFKPMVLMPAGLLAGLSVDQVEAILAHELAHIYRRDYLFNLLQTLIEALFYFNPGVWWISACIRIEREHCCDDIAVELCQNNLEYAKALVNIKELKQGFTPQLAMAAKGKKKHLLTRIQRILQQPVNTSDMSEKVLVTGLLAFLLVCMNLNAERKLPASSPEKPEISFTSTTLPEVPFEKVPVDTLPEGKITIRSSHDGKKIEAKILDRKIQELIVDGKAIPSAEYSNYEETLNEIIASVPPPPPPPNFAKTPPPPPGKFGDVPPPNMPPPPKVKGNGYYYYHNGDDHIIIEGPNRKGMGYQWNMDGSPGFKYGWSGFPPGFDRSIMINGTDSVEIARFFTPEFKFKNFDRINFKMDSLKIKMDTIFMRKLKGDLGHLKMNMDTAILRKLKGELGHLKMNMDNLKIQLGDKQFLFDGPKFKMDPDQFRYDFKMNMPMEKFRGMGNAKNRIEQTLLGDELIKPGSRYSFELTDKYLKIDGNKMPEALFDKYRRIYEESTGIKLEGESKIVLSN